MIIFNCRFTTIGGTQHDYKIREGDIEISRLTTDNRLELPDLFSSLQGIYGIDQDIGSLMDISKIEITQEDIAPEVFITFQQLRPFLNYESLDDERRIFGALEELVSKVKLTD